MTDAEYAKLRDQCEQFIAKWKALLGLQRYEIRTTYLRDKEDGEHYTMAIMNPNWEYNSGDLRIYVSNLAGKTTEDIECLIIHELLHLVLAPMHAKEDEITDDRRSVQEKVVTELAYSIQYAYLEALHQPKPRK